jgi:hypothetical protein
MRPTTFTQVLLAACLAACAGEPPPPPQGSSEALPNSDTFPTMPDSLVLTAPHGETVWFSGARVGTDSLGGECIERGLVIVTDNQRRIVPLLMTGEIPVLVDDSTMRARVWLQCVPGDTYEVDLRTGTPVRQR